MPTDYEIARDATVKPIADIAEQLGLGTDDWRPQGRDVAKVDPALLQRPRPANAGDASKLILVSAITPTPAGEGKTTTSIGLAQGLNRIGKRACLALREPSLGPSFGMKGGATGGGYSQVVPRDRINLHFTGDFHAITSAHNLLAAVLDNHLYWGNELGIDPTRPTWPRVMDMNDRSLRNMMTGLGGRLQGIPRETGFDITAASEVMAMLCLAESEADLRERIDRVIVGYTRTGDPVRAAGLKTTGAMLALLRDALWPNLVQTLEGTPAFVHGGPFANIAHGCNSVLATRLAMHVSDYTVTEAGFACDLGAEKFFDIKCRGAGLDPSAVVLVATIRALKHHGGAGKDELKTPNPDRVLAGLCNLEKHIENVQAFGKQPVVALNRFADDSDEEIAAVADRCKELGARFAASDHHARGGAGAEDLARAVVDAAEQASAPFTPLYELSDPIKDKVTKVAQKMYGAKDVAFDGGAEKALARVEKLGLQDLPICVAKTPASLSDDPKRLGRPEGFTVTVRDIQVNTGAGFLVVLTGEILRMPGLPRKPRAEDVDLDGTEITGLS